MKSICRFIWLKQFNYTCPFGGWDLKKNKMLSNILLSHDYLHWVLLLYVDAVPLGHFQRVYDLTQILCAIKGTSADLIGAVTSKQLFRVRFQQFVHHNSVLFVDNTNCRLNAHFEQSTSARWNRCLASPSNEQSRRRTSRWQCRGRSTTAWTQRQRSCWATKIEDRHSAVSPSLLVSLLLLLS